MARRSCSPPSAMPFPGCATSSPMPATPARSSKPHAQKLGKWTIEIVKRVQTTPGFHLIKRRWVVERTLAWLNRNRRLAKDFEASIESAVAWLLIASIKLLTRRLARAYSNDRNYEFKL